jgi:hypothetical protein
VNGGLLLPVQASSVDLSSRPEVVREILSIEAPHELRWHHCCPVLPTLTTDRRFASCRDSCRSMAARRHRPAPGCSSECRRRHARHRSGAGGHRSRVGLPGFGRFASLPRVTLGSTRWIKKSAFTSNTASAKRTASSSARFGTHSGGRRWRWRPRRSPPHHARPEAPASREMPTDWPRWLHRASEGRHIADLERRELDALAADDERHRHRRQRSKSVALITTARCGQTDPAHRRPPW